MKRPRFWFQVVFTYLSAQFVVGGLTYLVAPEAAHRGLEDLARRLGAADEVALVVHESLVWRTLAGTNVLTLGAMCLLLQLDVKRFFPVLYPLVFMKGATAIAFLVTGVRLDLRVLVAAGLYDAFNVLLMLIFAPAARRA